MKQVDFYLISNRVADAKYKLASRLSNKLLRLKKRALIVTQDNACSQHLDQVMWSFSDTSFVAHDRLGRPDPAAAAELAISYIHIAEAQHITEAPWATEYDVLINLSSGVPPFNHQFVRIAEIVEQNEAAKALARTRFKRYKDAGFGLKTHQIEL